ncbi:MAG TPA: SRPBCC family protein [Streptosporangiaceae bacterium]|nr:SRPBCC family protein [Streptosporangiaceae bacterium]
MRIEQQVDVPVPVDQVWAFLDDVPRVASCMPGASLSRVIDPSTVEGVVEVKVGPITVSYQGKVVIEERDPTGRTVRMLARGRDRKGAGTAQATVVAALTEPDPGSTRIAVSSDVRLTGRVATLGRGVQEVAATLFAEFADRMSAEIKSGPEAAVTAGPGPAAPVAGTGDAAASPPAAGRNAPIGLLGLIWTITRRKAARLLTWLRGRR